MIGICSFSISNYENHIKKKEKEKENIEGSIRTSWIDNYHSNNTEVLHDCCLSPFRPQNYTIRSFYHMNVSSSTTRQCTPQRWLLRVVTILSKMRNANGFGIRSDMDCIEPWVWRCYPLHLDYELLTMSRLQLSEELYSVPRSRVIKRDVACLFFTWWSSLHGKWFGKPVRDYFPGF